MSALEEQSSGAFSVFRQAIAAVSKRRIVVIITDSRIKTNAFYYWSSLQSFDFCISVKLIKIGYAQRQIGVDK